jgi:hypothetical protein
MATARSGARATLLRDGRVLVVGGSPSSSSAELYDPSMGTFSSTGSMSFDRSDHQAVLLQDGRVLVVGGAGITAAEIYDPTTGTFSTTGNLAADRFSFGATLLPNGKVLLAGGLSGGTEVNTTEIFDPATGLFEAGPPMRQVREVGVGMQILLGDGTVLISGGTAATERFRP